MDKTKRGERLAVLSRILSTNPRKQYPFSYFCDLFSAAKSSISEDVALVGEALSRYGLGELHTVTGAAGGVYYKPQIPAEEAKQFVQTLCEELNKPQRILQGGYLYMSDLLSDPLITRKMGEILAGAYDGCPIDFVLTMETKGIPVAFMAADALNVPLVIARRSSKVYEGSAVNISYPNGKGGIENMSLARRAVKEGQHALIVDDFIRDGGTARGMLALMEEFSVTVEGMAFVLAQESARRSAEWKQTPLMIFSGGVEDEPFVVKPAPWLLE